MSDTIIMRLTTRSEREFFQIINGNSCVSLKNLYRKICRKQVFLILKRLEFLQEHLQMNILTKKAEFCKITGLPVVNIYFNIKIELKELNEKENIAVISSL